MKYTYRTQGTCSQAIEFEIEDGIVKNVQFYGFLPRMFLGILLGYMFYITNSLWISILMHFANNGTAVVLYYLNYNGIVNIDPDHFGATESVWILFASALVTSGLIAWSWWKSQRTPQGSVIPSSPA